MFFSAPTGSPERGNASPSLSPTRRQKAAAAKAAAAVNGGPPGPQVHEPSTEPLVSQQCHSSPTAYKVVPCLTATPAGHHHAPCVGATGEAQVTCCAQLPLVAVPGGCLLLGKPWLGHLMNVWWLHHKGVAWPFMQVAYLLLAAMSRHRAPCDWSFLRNLLVTPKLWAGPVPWCAATAASVCYLAPASAS